MFKRLLIRSIIDFLALFVIFCGIDKLLGNEVAFAMNLIFALIFSALKNLMGMRKYYNKDLNNEINDKDKEEEN